MSDLICRYNGEKVGDSCTMSVFEHSSPRITSYREISYNSSIRYKSQPLVESLLSVQNTGLIVYDLAVGTYRTEYRVTFNLVTCLSLTQEEHT